MTQSSGAGGANRKVVLGKIVGAFGVAGWVKVESYTDPPENILKYGSWQLIGKDGEQLVKPLTGRVAAKGVQAQIEGVADRDAAERLRGAVIAVERSELPALGPGEVYWDDLVGLEAYSPAGERLGSILDIRETPAHALLHIVNDRAELCSTERHSEHWVPMVGQRLLKVDLGARRVTVDWEPDW